MAEGVNRANWKHTSVLAAGIYQQLRDPDRRPLEPADFDPYAHRSADRPATVRRGSMPINRSTIGSLKTMFVDGGR